ncbi:pyridoxal phosphate-dependent transferase [Vibrio barjaei]|uniref:Pyridoxal phosphate-dependent transferase n=1 Tax=Vibrio barjaei TaxID=1676683 RepID=A0ABW7IDF2_9VIBR
MILSKPFGGEQEIANDGLHYGVTNSGRSSLRWIIQSMSLQGKKVLVPDFLCQVVVDTLTDFGIEVGYYSVETNFDFTLPDALTQYDALYLVRYFGHDSKSLSERLTTSPIPLIIDDVFGVGAPSLKLNVQWCYFNSLRKISTVTDYSEVVSNFPLRQIKKEALTLFADKKLRAKQKKYDYLNKGLGSESSYLDESNEAERLLNTTSSIYEPSDLGLVLSRKFYATLHTERQHHQSNHNIVNELLIDVDGIELIEINSDFCSFQPILLENRDTVRKELFSHGAFLAVHWPELVGVSNKLSGRILSIPLDSRYSNADIKALCRLLIEIHESIQ